MKKKILLSILSLLCIFCLVGCGEDKVNRETKSEGNNRFIDTGDSYYINGSDKFIFYDSITKIVYIEENSSYGGGISPLYNKDRQPMTIEEYNETK